MVVAMSLLAIATHLQTHRATHWERIHLRSQWCGLSQALVEFCCFRAMDIAACAWLLLLVCLGGCLCFILWAALCKAFYSINGEFGNELAVRQFGQHAFHVVLGDYSTKLVYEEIFLKKVYFNHQISLDQHGPLVLDVGGNIGFFSAFVAEHYKGSRRVAFPDPRILELMAWWECSCGKHW